VKLADSAQSALPHLAIIYRKLRKKGCPVRMLKSGQTPALPHSKGTVYGSINKTHF
jgi:hypothetical protein